MMGDGQYGCFYDYVESRLRRKTDGNAFNGGIVPVWNSIVRTGDFQDQGGNRKQELHDRHRYKENRGVPTSGKT